VKNAHMHRSADKLNERDFEQPVLRHKLSFRKSPNKKSSADALV